MAELQYHLKDNIILDTLKNGTVSDSMVLHNENFDSGISDINEKLDSIGMKHADIFDSWNLSYRVFASKDESKVQKVAELYDSGWNNLKNLKEHVLGLYEQILPDCCISRLKVDNESGINSIRRYATQLVEVSRKFMSSDSDFYESRLKVSKEEKDREIEKDKKRIKEETGLTKDQDINKVIEDRNIQTFDNSRKLGTLKNIDEIAKVVYNNRLSSEFPMCRPECENVFGIYTIHRIESMKGLGYDVKSFSNSVGNFVENNLYNHFWGDRNSSTAELEEIIPTLGSEKIKTISHMEKIRVSDDIINLKEMDGTVLGMKPDFVKK